MNDKADQQCGPLFVVGMNGSGTTMLLSHLEQHPDLYGYPLETYILPYYLRAESKYGNLQVDSNFLQLWKDICSSYVFCLRNAGRPIELPDDWSVVPRNTAGIFDWIMRESAVQEGKSRWAEKTPMHVLHIEQLAKAFVGSRFIHMIRDGRDCAASDHRRWARHPAATICRWKNVVVEGRRQGRSIGDRYLELRYEDVTKDPRYHMKLACEFAGLNFDERVLRTERPQAHTIGHDSKTIIWNPQRNKGYFSPRCLRSLEQYAGRRLTELGYDTTNCDGDRTPSFLTRSWWALYDSARVTVRHIVEKYTVQKKMTWRQFFRRWKMIMRSKMSDYWNKRK